MSNINDLQQKTALWSDSAFGKNRSPEGAIHHLKEEVEELLQEPYDPMEYADCFLLLLDAARMANIGADDLLQFAYAKLHINRKRKWTKPDNNGVSHHL